jgi:hypothetical protein
MISKEKVGCVHFYNFIYFLHSLKRNGIMNQVIAYLFNNSSC